MDHGLQFSYLHKEYRKMKRRDFCKLSAAAASMIAAPAIGQEAQPSSEQAGDLAQSSEFKAFDSPTQVRDYAEFCACPSPKYNRPLFSSRSCPARVGGTDVVRKNEICGYAAVRSRAYSW
jgi:hypothetical protein